MRKNILSIVVVLSIVTQARPVAQTGAPPTSATDLMSTEIQAALKKAADENITDQMLGLVDIGPYNVGVALVIRRPATKAGAASMNALSHNHITEIYYILRGSGTQETGGTMGEPKPTGVGSRTIGASVTSPVLQDARRSNLSAGDVQIIPPGVPHRWISVGPEGVDYLVFRVDADHVLSVR